MPLPANWNTVTVTATFLKPDGTPATGNVQFVAVRAVGMDDTVVLPHPIVATLNGSGQMTASLPCPDDAGAGFTTLVYGVLERTKYGRAAYFIELDNAMTSVELEDVPRVAPIGEQESYALTAQGFAAQAIAAAASADVDAAAASEAKINAAASALAAASSETNAAASALAAGASETNAEASKNAAALSASTAESAAGPTYANVGAGEAATTAGQSFAVDNGDGTVSVYLRTGGGSTLQRTLATTAALAGTGAGQGASMVGFLQSGTGAVARTMQEKGREVVSLEDFGAAGDGVTDDTAALSKALTKLSSGGELRLQPKTYLIRRGNGAAIYDNILADNITITGNGARIVSRNAAGAVPNDYSNEYYNVFQATGRKNITIRGIDFSGYCVPVHFENCEGVLIDGINDNGILANAGKHYREKSVYFNGCERVRVVNSDFLNFHFGVYLSGTGGSRCRDVVVANNNFKHTEAAGGYTAVFPVGVYVFYADDVVINGNTFRNIYSSVDNGTTGTGIGYAIYEGDGACNQFTANDNVLRYEARGSKQAHGFYINQAESAICTGNTVYAESGAGLVEAFLIDAKIDGVTRIIDGNNVTNLATVTGRRGVYCTGSTVNKGRVLITGNTFNGGSNAVRFELPNCSLDVSNNVMTGQYQAQIHIQGFPGAPIKFPRVVGNRISAGQSNGILFAEYVVSAHVIDNTILDGNLGNASGDFGAAIMFSGYSFGSCILNNTIGNTPVGGGLFTFGVQNASNAADRIFKDIAANNNFIGITGHNNRFGNYWTSSPTNGIFDACKGDFFQNVQLNASGAPGWFCVQQLLPTLAANASNASTTVTVSSTSGMAAGDIVLLCKDSNPYDADYATNANWHVDTVQSVTNGTQFVLTTGIPAGDGTYANGVGVVKVARFKAAAAIAA